MKRYSLIRLAILLALALLITPAHPVHADPTTRYAAPTASGIGDCSSWTDACTLQQALTAANNGDQIWVKKGVHYPGTTQTATFTLKNGVAIYGGFAGTETSLSQRNWRGNLTILSGDIDGNDNHGGDFINENASQIKGNNAYHVVTGGGTDSSAVLDGFVITAGQANGSSFPDHIGGGMYNGDSSPTLSNLIFSGNSATYGGGMGNHSSSPTLTNVTFSGNSASSGGGMVNDVMGNPTLTNVIFSGNSATGGGGMANYSSNPTLTNVTFSGNSATYGGGMANYYSSSPTLTNVILWGSSSGSIFNDNSIPTISYSDIEGCIVSGTWQNSCGTDGGHNIDADPQFVDADGADNTVGTLDDNLRLDFGSPAIDKGASSGCPTTDLDNLPRPTDGDANGTPTCDMGAYEAGTMICNVTATTHLFSSSPVNVNIEVTNLGTLACLYVDEMGLNHPNATSGIKTGRYWLIRALQSDKTTPATSYGVNLTLPTNFTPDGNDKVCRYTGSGTVWDCAMSGYTSNAIARDGITALSDWAVGNNVGPTAVRLRSLTAVAAPAEGPALFGIAALLVLACFLVLLKQASSRLTDGTLRRRIQSAPSRSAQETLGLRRLRR